MDGCNRKVCSTGEETENAEEEVKFSNKMKICKRTNAMQCNVCPSPPGSDLRTLRIPQPVSPQSVGVNDNDDYVDGRLGTVTR